MRNKRLHVPIVKGVVSLVALALVQIHIWKPSLKIDSISIALLIIGLLPWVYTFVESAKLPGGWEIKFRDVKEAEAKIEASPSGARKLSTTSTDVGSRIASLGTSDPNLALVGLRIEIENSLRVLAQKTDTASTGSLSHLLHVLTKLGHLPTKTSEGLQTLIGYGNQAAHGARVDPDIADWALRAGPDIINTLQSLPRTT